MSSRIPCAVPLAFAFAFACALPASAQTPVLDRVDTVPDAFVDAYVEVEGLGAVAFPNSGAAEAQEAFQRGVLLLHSFEFGPAAKAFREAQAIDPEFALAFWGEAMTYNHPLWRQQDREQALAVLHRLAPTPAERRAKAPTEREKMYLDAVEALYAEEGSKQERDRMYMETMERLARAYLHDDEARTFYALSILGSENGSRDFATYMKAAATAQVVFDRNALHPGAVHYIIHSFDDPVHAPLGFEAADAYADIAPHAAHAQHMTSHIFVAMGLWERTVEANIRARDTEDAELAREGKAPNVCGHYSSWLHYAHLQLGETDEAEDLMDRCHEGVTTGTDVSWDYFASMRARHIVDTEDWTLADKWAVPIEAFAVEEGWSGYADPRLQYRITNALADLQRGETAQAVAIVEEEPRPETPGAALQIDQLAGLVEIERGETDEGLALLKKAAQAEDALPLEFGPPHPVKPTFELLGEELQDAGRHGEAEAAFRRAVERTPGRTLAERGLREVSSIGGTQ